MAERRNSALREWLRLAVAVLAMFAARSSLADHYRIPSGSMEHTLLAGDRVLVDKRAYGFRLPFTRWTVLPGESARRGEVAIFDSPVDGQRLIKRIVAIGGDEVHVRNGRLIVNGRPLALDASRERFGERVADLNLRDGGGPDVYIAEMPGGMVLAVGDHRGNSHDGRMFGLVPEDALYGRAVAVYYRRGELFTWRRL